MYGDSDLFGHEVAPLDTGPIRAYGSLAQIQGRAGPHLEDWTADLPADQDPGENHALFFKNARDHRSLFSVDSFVRKRVCDPEHVLSVEEVIGNAPTFESDIRDSSHARLRESDMRVPSDARGESAFESTRYASRECPSGGGCDLETPFSFRDSSMLIRVYVTSSDDPEVLPGVHRLLDLKGFPDVDCNMLKGQRCGVERTLVPHGRKQPKCGVFCSLGRAAAGVGTALVATATLAMSAFPNPTPLPNAYDGMASYLFPYPPVGATTDVVRPYSAIGRAAMYGVAPSIYGVATSSNRGSQADSASREWARDHAGNAVRGNAVFGPAQGPGLNLPRRRGLRTSDYKSRQVDWTYDAVFSATHINVDDRYREPVEAYMTGRDFLLRARCLPLSIDISRTPGARHCGFGETAWFRGTSGCYQNELTLASKPSTYGRLHFLHRLGVPPPPPRPPPGGPPPSPPPPPHPDLPPQPPAGFSPSEMATKVGVVSACASSDSNPQR